MRRQRLTWQQRGGADRRASAHPAYPDEGPASPAYKPDPEADAYENGDTSSWAEDPHPGPYPNSAHPAYPDEGPASPAYKAASLERALEKKAARCLRLASALMGPGAPQMAVEDQALSLMDLSDRAINASLARLAGDEPPEEEAEEAAPEKSEAKKKARTIKALLRMIADEDEDEADEDAEEVEEADEEVVVESKKKASFRRFSKKADDAEKAVEEAEDAADVVEGTKEEAKKKAALRRLARAVRAAEEKVVGAEEAEDKGEGDKKASRRLAKIRRDFNEVRRAFRRLAADDGNETGGGDEAEEAPEAKKASSRRRAYGWAMTPHMGDDTGDDTSDEAMLLAMLKGEGMEGGVDPTEAMGFVAEDHDPEAEAMLAQLMAETEAPAAPAEAMYAEDVPMDPLGVLADDDMGLTDDDYMLASLFGKSAAKDEAEEAPSKEEAEDAPADEGKKEEAAKKASRLRPQPKTASTGATRLGGGVIGKAAASEVTELSALWESAPDVSKFF